MSEDGTLTTQLVLLADDNEEMSTVIEDMLDFLGFEVAVARDGRTAVEMAAANAYTLILMDIEMPVMDGLAAAEAIRLREQADLTPAVPILGITGHTDRGTHLLCQRAGMNDVLTKPFLMVQLEEKVKAACGARLN